MGHRPAADATSFEIRYSDFEFEEGYWPGTGRRRRKLNGNQFTEFVQIDVAAGNDGNNGAPARLSR